MMLEHFFQCPYCWEQISMLLDKSVSEKYIEDCEICCNPIQITTLFSGSELINFEVKSIEQ